MCEQSGSRKHLFGRACAEIEDAATVEASEKRSYLDAPRQRARRRRSPWNLLLIPACLGAFAAIYWAYLAFADWVVNKLFPRYAYFRTFSRLGTIPRSIPALSLVLTLRLAPRY